MIKKQSPRIFSFNEVARQWFKIYGWVILLILFAVSGIFYLLTPEKFNPETDICIKECDGTGHVYGCDEPGHDGYRKCRCYVLPGDPVFYQYWDSHENCVEWRSKTFCELCLDGWTAECDERCQCDGWETIRVLNTSMIKEGCRSIGQGNHICLDIGDEWESAKINGQDIEVGKNYTNPYYEVRECTKAHEKTISDLNCDELMDYYENGPQCHKWIPPFFVWDCKYPAPHTHKRNILYEMIRKGCGGIA